MCKAVSRGVLRRRREVGSSPSTVWPRCYWTKGLRVAHATSAARADLLGPLNGAAAAAAYQQEPERGRRYPMTFIRLPISIAVMAASKPLLPAFVPARSIACSIVSVVRTP